MWLRQWDVTLYFGEVNGRKACVGMDLRSFVLTDPNPAKGGFRGVPGPRGLSELTTALLRRLPLTRFVRSVRESDRELLELIHQVGVMNADTRWWIERRLTAEQALRRETQRRGGRPEVDAGTLMKVAEIYEDAYRRQLPPTKAVEEALGIPYSTAAKRVRLARKAGLLGAATPGRAGGVDPDKRRAGARRATKKGSKR